MFILRDFTADKCLQSNTCLGDRYSLVYETDGEIFKDTMKIVFGSNIGDIQNPIDSYLYAFLVYDFGKEIIPLWKDGHYWIMTESGKTFANITYK